MTDNGQYRVEAIKTRFKAMEVHTGDPKWSSWVLDRMLEEAMSTPGGSLRDVYAGLDAALSDYAVPLTQPVAHLIRDVVVKGFTAHRSAYEETDWGWVNEELQISPSPARCYLFLHALPPEATTPSAAAAIVRGLHGTAYWPEARHPRLRALFRAQIPARATRGPADPDSR
jgi:hypothetical protein